MWVSFFEGTLLWLLKRRPNDWPLVPRKPTPILWKKEPSLSKTIPTRPKNPRTWPRHRPDAALISSVETQFGRVETGRRAGGTVLWPFLLARVAYFKAERLLGAFFILLGVLWDK